MAGWRIAAFLLALLSVRLNAQTLSFWSDSIVPPVLSANDSASVSLGLKFYTDMPGSVTGVRFYKGSGNSGTHTGQLWSGNGTRLAEVTFANETAAGWQKAFFSPPVSIAANTVYIVSYVAPRGRYAHQLNYPWAKLARSVLHAAGGASGVYTYGAGARLPASTWNTSNYWVDVMFVPNPLPPARSTFTISGTVTSASAILTLSGTTAAITRTDSGGRYQFTGLTNGIYVVAPSQPGYQFRPSASLVPINGASASGVNFASSPLPVGRGVTLSWTASISRGVIGYNVYRSPVPGGPYVKQNASPIVGTTWIDTSANPGRTYFYVATAVDGNNAESAYSDVAYATLPQ